jgi:thiol-disulfide isomerase/thioredoxin
MVNSKLIIGLLMLIMVMGCSVTSAGRGVELKPEVTERPASKNLYPDMGDAPEITNEVWINSETPLTLGELRGKVVLLEFWTFGCINCQRTLPYVNRWYDEYSGDSFAVLGIHYPEFAHERDYENVVDAIGRLEVEYPVALDNEGQTWRAYGQRFWPTIYLIDKSGDIRYKHIGEFNRESAEAFTQVIETLLTEPAPNLVN